MKRAWVRRGQGVLLAAVLACAGPAGAAERLTAAEIFQLEPEQVFRMPVEEYLGGVFPQVKRPDLLLAIQIALRELGYYHAMPDGKAGPEHARAVRAFKASMGAKPGGTLTVAETAELSARLAAFAPVTLLVAGRHVSADEEGVFAQGSWSGSGPGWSPPYGFVTISCKFAAGCRERGVDVEQGLYGFTNFLRLRSYEWRIVEAAPTRVVAETLRGRCAKATLVVDAEAQLVEMVQGDSGEPGCAPLKDAPWRTELANGETMSEQARDRTLRARDEARDPAYRRVLERARATEAWKVFDLLKVMRE